MPESDHSISLGAPGKGWKKVDTTTSMKDQPKIDPSVELTHSIDGLYAVPKIGALPRPIERDLSMTQLLKQLIVGQDGATMVEYAMMLALIGAALITAVTALSTSIGSKFTSVSTTLSGS